MHSKKLIAILLLVAAAAAAYLLLAKGAGRRDPVPGDEDYVDPSLRFGQPLTADKKAQQDVQFAAIIAADVQHVANQDSYFQKIVDASNTYQDARFSQMINVS